MIPERSAYVHPHGSLSSFPSPPKSRKKVGIRELEIETQVAQMMGRAHTKAPDSSLFEPSKPGEGEDKTYLLFTTGSLTYSPHQIGEPRTAGQIPAAAVCGMSPVHTVPLVPPSRYQADQARPDDHLRPRPGGGAEFGGVFRLAGPRH